MVPEFDRTTRALAADRGPGLVVLLGLMALLLAWGGWLVGGSLTLYESASAARVSADGVARLLAPVSAVVAEVPGALGAPVEAGALIVQLDDRALRLELAAAQAQVEGLSAQLSAVGAALDAESAGRAAGEGAERAGLEAARASLEEARVRTAEALQAVDRLTALRGQSAASAAELDEAVAELQARQARERVLAGQLEQASRLLQQRALEGVASERRAAEARVELERQLRAAQAEVLRLEQLIAERALRTPVAGTLGELAPLAPGQRVEAGALLAVVVPPTAPVIEARFLPERAVGRVQPGQAARVRIVGAAGGSLGARLARVEQVGSEPGPDGLVPVRLRFDTPGEDLHHGLLAEVEVEVETTRPLTLLVRAAGQASGR